MGPTDATFFALPTGGAVLLPENAARDATVSRVAPLIETDETEEPEHLEEDDDEMPPTNFLV